LRRSRELSKHGRPIPVPKPRKAHARKKKESARLTGPPRRRPRRSRAACARRATASSASAAARTNRRDGTEKRLSCGEGGASGVALDKRGVTAETRLAACAFGGGLFFFSPDVLALWCAAAPRLFAMGFPRPLHSKRSVWVRSARPTKRGWLPCGSNRVVSLARSRPFFTSRLITARLLYTVFFRFDLIVHMCFV
jgi:hypothetical protein